jgi:hypothetical protein
MASFGRQGADVNVSLTAIGMLWTVVDFLSHAKATTSATSSAGGKGDGKGGGKGGGKSGGGVVVGGGLAGPAWDAMLEELGRLAVDTRPEVRNCAVNTLVSSVSANGKDLTAPQWRHCLVEVLVPLVRRVEGATAKAASKTGGVAASIHEVHTATKQNQAKASKSKQEQGRQAGSRQADKQRRTRRSCGRDAIVFVLC